MYTYEYILWGKRKCLVIGMNSEIDENDWELKDQKRAEKIR
jgi:hypothetical protein